MEQLNDGRQILCPMGRSALCGAGVNCLVEERVLEVEGPESDPNTIDKFCAHNPVACTSLEMFRADGMTQSDYQRRVDDVIEDQEQSDEEVLAALDREN